MSARVYPGIRSVFLNTIILRGFGFCFGLANSIIVARFLGAQGRGQLTLLLTEVMFLTLVLGQLGNSNTILVGRDQKSLGTLLCHSLLFSIGSTAAAWLFYSVLPFRDSVFASSDGTAGLTFALFFLVLYLQVLSGGFNGLLLGKQDFFYTNYVAIVGSVLVLAFNWYFLVVRHLEVPGALLTLAINLGFSALVSFAWLAKSPGAFPPRPWFSRPLFGEGIAVGARAVASNLPTALMLRFDTYLIDYFLGYRELGVYSVAVNVAELVLIVSGTLNTIAFAKGASEAGVEAGVARSSRFCLAVSLAFCAAFAVAGRPLFSLAYGSEFAGSFVPCLVVLVGVSAHSFASPLAGYIVGVASYPRAYIIVAWVGFAVNLIANLLLIPLMGIAGAALATAIAYSVTSLMVLALFLNVTGMGMGRFCSAART